jgi:hypothetical protein
VLINLIVLYAKIPQSIFIAGHTSQ